MTTRVSTAQRPGATATVTNAAAMCVLAAVGYIGAANLHVTTALFGGVVLLVWTAVAFQRPHVAVAASFAGVLLANTKFRIRDADASLAGAIDGQIMLEIGVYAAIGLGLLAMFAAGRLDRRRLSTAEGAVIAYAAFAVLSIAWSLAPILTLVRSAQLCVIALLALATARLFSPAQGLRGVITAVAAFVLICTALTIVFPFARGTFVEGEHDGFRFAWFAAHPIEVGTFAAIAALGVISTVLFREAGRPRLPLIFPAPIAALLLMGVLAATAARGPILAFAVGLFTLLLLKVEIRARAAIVLVGLAFVGALAIAGPDLHAWLASASSGDSRLTYTFFRGQSAQDVLELNGRLELWGELRPAIVQNMFLGHGYLASRAVILDAADWAAAAHNALLQSLLDLGILGTLGLIALIGAGFVGTMRAHTQWRRAALAAIVVFLVVNSISTESFAGAPGFEMFLVFLCALFAGWDAADTSVAGDAA